VEQEVELLRGQLDGLAGDGDAPLAGIDDDVAEHDRALAVRRVAVAVHTTEHRVHACDQLGGRERLDDVVVGAELQADDAVGLLATRRQQDHGDVAVLAQPRHHLQAVEAGQHHVEHDEVRPVLERGLDGGRAVGGGDGVKPVATEVARDDLRDRRLVVDHEDRLRKRHASIVRRVIAALPRVSRGFRSLRAVVNLDRIYTRAGDQGETSLGDGRRVPKDDPRIEAYGTIDELGAVLGVVRTLELPARFDGWLGRIQNDLFDLGADLAVPEQQRDDRESERERTRLRVTAEQVTWLEQRCDEVNEGLEPLRSFVLAGGTPAAAQLHLARTVARRAERHVVSLASREPINPLALAYVNRLSDLLFILARAANPAGREILWVPGG
jgi:cob(I)alamin adenosyltransferase